MGQKVSSSSVPGTDAEKAENYIIYHDPVRIKLKSIDISLIGITN